MQDTQVGKEGKGERLMKQETGARKREEGTRQRESKEG